MAQNEGKKGVWAITTAEGQVFIENSEIKALRIAVSTQGKHEFIEWGQAVGQHRRAAANKTAGPAQQYTGEQAMEGPGTIATSQPSDF